MNRKTVTAALATLSLGLGLGLGFGLTSSPSVTFRATFAKSISPFQYSQCAPGTPSKPPRYRGTFTLDTVDGLTAASITDPITPAGYPLTACDLETPSTPLGVGTTEYVGLAFYIPPGFEIPNTAFDGANLYELRFQNIYGAPVTLQLHDNSVVLALETGACQPYTTPDPGCAYRSNAGAAPCKIPGVNCLPGLYAIPPGKLVDGAWNEIVLHANWESTPTGYLHAYYRTRGGRWTSSAVAQDLPTVQYAAGSPCCEQSALDELELYTAALTAPLTVSFTSAVDGTGLRVVEQAMP